MELLQMKASFNAQRNENKDAQGLHQQYKEDLDALIKIKQGEMLKTKDLRNKDADLIAQSVQNCKDLEEKQKRFKRERERTLLQESQVFTQMRKDELVKQKANADALLNEHLKESLVLESINLKAKKEKHLKEKEGFQNHYHQVLSRKNEEKEEERRRNMQFYDEEKKNLEKMERENAEFMESIRNRLSKNKSIFEFYEKLNANNSENQLSEYKRIVEIPALEHFQRELEKEQQDLMAKKLLKTENNQFILEQIENNAQKKEMLQYQQARLEYELLVEELEHQNHIDQETKISRKKKLMDVLNTLKNQIERKNSHNSKINFMNMHESRVNDAKKYKDEIPINLEEFGSSIPGYTMAYERKKQINIIEQSSKLNNHFLTNAISSPLMDNFKSSTVSRRKIFQPDNGKSHLFNKENVNRQPSEFTNDYQYIRFMNKNQTFDIISNNLKQF
jgi:hypothetical protein